VISELKPEPGLAGQFCQEDLTIFIAADGSTQARRNLVVVCGSGHIARRGMSPSNRLLCERLIPVFGGVWVLATQFQAALGMTKG